MKLELSMRKQGAVLYEGVHEVIDAETSGRTPCVASQLPLSAKRLAPSGHSSLSSPGSCAMTLAISPGSQ